MATETVGEGNFALFKQEGLERHEITLEAAFELESLAGTLIQLSQRLPAVDLVIRSLGFRAKDLAGVMISALNDADERPASIRQRLTGDNDDSVDRVEEAAHG